jgi:hypothetical protein
LHEYSLESSDEDWRVHVLMEKDNLCVQVITCIILSLWLKFILDWQLLILLLSLSVPTVISMHRSINYWYSKYLHHQQGGKLSLTRQEQMQTGIVSWNRVLYYCRNIWRGDRHNWNIITQWLSLFFRFGSLGTLKGLHNYIYHHLFSFTIFLELI